MKRAVTICAVGLLVTGGLFAWNSTKANDNEKTDVDNQSVEISEVQNLVDRIEALEKRLAALEEREPLVRQADSRDELSIPVPRTPATVPPNKLNQSPNLPDAEQDDDDDSTQQTNGQKWRFRLLGRRKSI